MSKYWLLIGSFDPLITTLQFTTTSPPSLSFVSQFNSGSSPSWLANYPKFPTTIYATDERDTGFINSLKLDLNTGCLTPLANVSTQGSITAHLGFINDGATLGAANFGTGSAFVVDLDTAGQFIPNGALVPFQGSGPLLPIQASSHAHQVGIVFRYRSPRTSLQTGFYLLRLCHSMTSSLSRTSARTRFGALCSRTVHGKSRVPLIKHLARVPGISS